MMVWGMDVGEGWRIAAGILDAGFDGFLVGLEGWVGEGYDGVLQCKKP